MPTGAALGAARLGKSSNRFEAYFAKQKKYCRWLQRAPVREHQHRRIDLDYTELHCAGQLY